MLVSQNETWRALKAIRGPPLSNPLHETLNFQSHILEFEIPSASMKVSTIKKNMGVVQAKSRQPSLRHQETGFSKHERREICVKYPLQPEEMATMVMSLYSQLSMAMEGFFS
jgi:hypothetical protein